MTEIAIPTVTRFVQDPKSYAWTFGGYDPIRHVRPGDVLDLYVEDCFAGRIRSTADLPSKSIEYPFINPQTGPFYVEGAEIGDTLAVHLVDVQPARDWAVSTTFPLFGALTGTKYTATLQPALPERTWLYRVDRAAGRVIYSALDSDFEVGLPLQPFHGTIGVAPAATRPATSSSPRRSAGTWTRPRLGRGRRCTSA